MNTATRTELRSSHLRAFRLGPADRGGERVALVPEQAVLLAGDGVTVSVRVAAGQRLEIVEPGGTVAYGMRGGGARWDVDIEVEDGGCLVWHGEPFVVAEGADVARTLRVDLGATSVVTLRETLVLGRSGEEPGRLRSRTDVSRDGAPVLLEELDSDVGLGAHRVVDQVLALGGFEAQAPERRRTSATEPGSMVLASGDRLRRWLGAETHASPIHGCYSRLSYSRLSYSSPRDE